MILATAKPLLIAGALLCATGAGWWLHAGSLRAELDAAKAAKAVAESALESAQFANAEWQTATLETHAALAQCQQQWTEATESAARAQAQAEQGRRDAERVRAAFLDRYAGRGTQCSDALAALDVACPQVGDY